eukprot:256629_1
MSLNFLQCRWKHGLLGTAVSLILLFQIIGVYRSLYVYNRDVTYTVEHHVQSTQLLGSLNITNLTCINPVFPVELLLIHIPKTGGTSISETAWNNHICWGEHIQHITDTYWRSIVFNICKTLNICGISIWHIPTRYILQYIHANEDEKHSLSLYFNQQLYDYFCVVRNPFTRIISQYQYSILWSWKNLNKYGWSDTFGRYPKHKRMWCTAKALNFWIKYYLIAANESLCVDDCHWAPQYQYIFDSYGNRICNHILHFENLTMEFNALMHKYNLHQLLDLNGTHFKPAAFCKQLSLDDVSEETKRLIYEFYEIDFNTFSYAYNQ